ncbi:MAG: tol-pal system-associated acyl-CoA thioesterase [Hyphomicrobiales bacterium]|nr:tol-pal system-associated acyl-CoA thioesterase [Hyphomicrobiales bacterium]MDE2115711.1 tol-pal system-associated acyl-CoA thioesterase [Hyphomicrobiales bacterium]
MNAPHPLSVRVYYEDTDFSGVVYHAAYLRFMERGRTEYLRGLGIAQIEMHQTSGFGFAVRHMAIDFRASARMDDLLIVQTELTEIGGASLHMRQTILRYGQCLVTAEVKIAGVIAGKAARLPPDLRAKLPSLATAR